MTPSIADRTVPGGWSERQLTIGPHYFRLLTPADPDRLLDHLESPETTTQPHLADPYWAKLWPAAPLLAQAIWRNPPARGTSTLELGCGSGLVGLAALAAGLRVEFSDYVPLAVELAMENARRNGFSEARGRVLDWRRPGDKRFAFVVAADVTYDRGNLDLLLDVLEKMLLPSGEAWFGDAGRSPADDFCDRAGQRGWSVSLFNENDDAIQKCVLGQFQRIVLRRP